MCLYINVSSLTILPRSEILHGESTQDLRHPVLGEQTLARPISENLQIGISGLEGECIGLFVWSQARSR